MATAKQCLGIDIGTHSIRVAELAIGQAGVEVKNLVEAKLQLEAGQKEAQRQGAIVQQLGQLLKTNKIKVKDAVFCVPGQSVFVRRVRVPATTPDRLQRIIRFEAREQIPFPLEKTVLEYQVFETEVPSEVEVLMVAIKREYIENFMKLVSKTGLNPLSISVSSLALHNFHESNAESRKLIAENPKAKKNKKEKSKEKKKSAKKGFALKFGKKKGAAEETAVAVAEPEAEPEDEAYDSMTLEEIKAEVNIGATVMDLTIPKAGTQRVIGFTRSVPVAGAQIDRAIRTKLSVDTNEEAQRVKEQEAVVLASDFEIAGDTASVNMPASEAATAVVDRMIAELRRSLDFFISQPDGVAVDGITLSGGLAKMRYLSNYLEEKMGLPVELAGVKNEGFKISEELTDSVSSFVVPVGLALQGIGVGQISIDFLPQDIKNLRAVKDRQMQIVFAGILLVATIFASLQAGSRFKEINQRLANTYEDVAMKTTNEAGLIKKVEDSNKKIFDKYQAVMNAKGHRFDYLDLMLCILNNRPPDILIENLNVQSTGYITLSGRTDRRQAITEFLDNLTQDKLFVKEAAFADLKPATSDPRFKSQVFPFSLSITAQTRDGRYRGIKSTAAATVDASGRVSVGTANDPMKDLLEGNFGFGRGR